MKQVFAVLTLFCVGILAWCATHSEVVEEETTGVITESESKNTSTQALEENTSEEKICIQNPELSVFMYHYVRDDDPNDSATIRDLSVTPANFESHMQIVSRLRDENKIALMNGDEFYTAFTTNCFPHKRIWLFTSDDGWIDSITHLAPLAEKYHIPFMFGIITSKIGAPGFITQSDVEYLATHPLFTVSSHTMTHREHNRLSDADEKKEICESKATLESITRTPVHFFIYPVGKIGKSSEKYLQECGYTAAWSTHFGEAFDWNNPKPFIMNRIRIHHDTGAGFYERRGQVE